VIGQIIAEIWRFSIFQNGGHRRLDFKNFEILTTGTVKRVKLRHRAKFRLNRSNRHRNDDFAMFQDGGSRHLAFLNFGNFNCHNAQDAQTATSCQISWRSVQPLLRYSEFSISPRQRPTPYLGF